MKEITLQDYRDFCLERYDCDNCPLTGDALSGLYGHCLGYIAEHPEEADSAIQEWKMMEEKRKIEKRQSVWVIYDRYFSDTVYGVASSQETANKMLDALGQEALANCLAADAEDSGIRWDKMTKEQQDEFYNTQIMDSFVITEMKLDCYTYDEGVHAI